MSAAKKKDLAAPQFWKPPRVVSIFRTASKMCRYSVHFCARRRFQEGTPVPLRIIVSTGMVFTEEFIAAFSGRALCKCLYVISIIFRAYLYALANDVESILSIICVPRWDFSFQIFQGILQRNNLVRFIRLLL